MHRLAALAFLTVSLAGQDANQPLTTFKTTTKLVVVDVFVRNRAGKAIDNLKKVDFTLLENGKTQDISIFEFQRIDEEPTAPGGVIEALPSRANAISAEGPGKIKYKNKRLLVFFFDFSSMQPQEQVRAQEAALKFLGEQMGPADMVSIMSLAAGVQILQDFTNDRDRLTQVIKSFRIGQASELALEADTVEANTGEYNGAAFSADETEFNIFNTDRKLAGLETAVKMLAALPEKKAVIYFSSGIPKTGTENDSQIESTINAAVRANVSFYPIDARGLVALVPGGDASKSIPKGTALFTGGAITSQKTKLNNQQETLTTLAVDTGGKALIDSNDLSLGISQAQEDLGSYYILGYYDNNAVADGKFRRIQVNVPKSLSASVEYRPGYYAGKEYSKSSSADKERQLQEALVLGDPVTDLPIALEVNYFRLVKDRFFVPVAVKIPGAEVQTARRGGADTAEFDFIGQVMDARAHIVSNVRDTIRVKLGESAGSGLASRAIQYDTGFTLTPGQYRLKFLVRENLGGKMGTFETGFTVPSLSAPGAGLRMSSVVWSGQRQPVASAVGAGTNQKLLANHPLVNDGQKLIPSITRVLSRRQNLYVYFEIYDPAQAPDTHKPNIVASVSFYRKGVKAFESEPVQLSSLSKSREGTLPVQFQVPLAKLAAGRYTCQVNVVDEAGQKFEFLRAPMVLVP